MKVRILYHGLGMAGKTTNLEKLKEIYGQYVQERIHQQTTENRTVYLDMLALNLKTKLENTELSVEIFTTPGQERFKILRKWIFGHVDGLVMVLDSSRSLEENLRAYQELKEAGLVDIPMVVQVNKRDVQGAISMELLRNTLRDIPIVEAVAKDGLGVAETLRAILREVLNAKAFAG